MFFSTDASIRHLILLVSVTGENIFSNLTIVPFPIADSTVKLSEKLSIIVKPIPERSIYGRVVNIGSMALFYIVNASPFVTYSSLILYGLQSLHEPLLDLFHRIHSHE